MKAQGYSAFAEFRQKGITRRIDLVINVHEEPREDKYFIANIKPFFYAL